MVLRKKKNNVNQSHSHNQNGVGGSPRPASMFPALGSLAPLNEEEIPALIYENGFEIVPSPNSTHSSKLIGHRGNGPSPSKASRPGLHSSKSFGEEVPDCVIPLQKRNSFLHGARSVVKTSTVTTSRKEMAPSNPNSSPSRNQRQTRATNEGYDEANSDPNGGRESGDASSGLDYVQLDPELVKQFEKLRTIADGRGAACYSVPPPTWGAGSTDTNSHTQGDDDHDYEMASEALVDNESTYESSYDRLLHFTRKQFMESKVELEGSLDKTPGVASYNGGLRGDGGAGENNANCSAVVSPNRNFQFRGPSPAPPPVPPHQSASASALSSAARTSMTTATPYAVPESLGRAPVSLTEAADNDIPAYAVGYLTEMGADAMQEMTASSSFSHLSGIKGRSSSEPSVLFEEDVSFCR